MNEILNNINFDRFIFSLQYMWKGMFCIFVVIGVIVLSIVLMNSVINKRAKKNDKKEN